MQSQARLDTKEGMFNNAVGLRMKVRSTDSNRKFKVIAAASTSGFVSIQFHA